MGVKFWLPATGWILLCACTPHETVPNGASVLDEDVTLTRQANTAIDTATRELAVNDDAILVVTVDEHLTDVKLELALVGAGKNAAQPIEVENHLAGVGIEVAALDVPGGTKLRVTLTSAQDSAQAGKVHLRVRQYDADAANDTQFKTQLSALRAWSAATNSAIRADAVKKSGLADMQRAIDGLNTSPEYAALAAQARLVRAGMLAYFRIDRREARAEAQRAAMAFGALASPDSLNMARSRYLEALALFQMSGDGNSVNPTSAEAVQLARDILTELSAPASVLGPIERARVIVALGDIDLEAGNTDDARQRFEQAQTIYRDAGFSLGVFETRCSLAEVLLNRGQFREAALAFDPLLPELERIADVDRRVWLYISAARGQAFSGRGDEAQEILFKALALAREHKLRVREANALHGLGNVYGGRGDSLQAREFFGESMRISREEHDTVGLTGALELNGFIARADGDFARAIEMHQEAVQLASSPVARSRALRAQGLDYYFSGRYDEAIVQFRRALAEKLQDPTHHAYSDTKRELAEALIMHGDGKPATLDEAATLVAAALKKAIEVGDKQGEMGGHRVTGQLLAVRGKPVEAQREFELAFALGHEYREKFASSDARAAPLRQEQYAFRDYLDLMLRDVGSEGRPRLASKREERALRILETAREGNNAGPRTGELDAESAARVDGLLAKMAATSVKLAALQKVAKDNQAAELQALQLEMASLYGELDRVRTAAALKRASAENFRPSVTRAWRSLGPGVVQLSYALGNEHVYAWARTDTGILVTRLAPSTRDFERELIELAALDPQAAPEKVEHALTRVSAVLLPKGLLPQNSTAIEIAAEGRIASVPFPGLRSPDSPTQRLVETHAIAMVTSLFSVEPVPRPKQARPFRLVALASGHGTLRSARVVDPASKLQAATKEIRTVAGYFTARDPAANIKLLIGSEGSVLAVRNLWSSGADVVHFATHALADLRQPLASLLVLPALDASGTPTYVTAGQVESWRGDVELVFLSACESAIGPPRFAVGMPGLQRAFLRAGARQVIATLWPIEDVLAQEFSADFYKRYTSGQTAVQALSSTQRAWLAPRPGTSDAEQMRRRITALAHGLYTQ